jgi:hypothetical protein
MLAPNWPAIFRSLSIYAKFPATPGRLDSAILLSICTWAGILAVNTTKLQNAIPMVLGATCLTRDLFLLLLFPCYGVSNSLRSLKILAGRCNLAYYI